MEGEERQYHFQRHVRDCKLKLNVLGGRPSYAKQLICIHFPQCNSFFIYMKLSCKHMHKFITSSNAQPLSSHQRNNLFYVFLNI